MTNTPDDQKPIRVVVEVDAQGLVDVASDHPVELILLNHRVREDDETVSIRGIEVVPAKRLVTEIDIDYIADVWKEVHEFYNS